MLKFQLRDLAPLIFQILDHITDKMQSLDHTFFSKL